MTLRVAWLTAPGDPRTAAALRSVQAAVTSGSLDVDLCGVFAAQPTRRPDENALADQLERDRVDLGLLVGYPWIVGVGMLDRVRLVNVHPAPPGGPIGREPEVVDALLARRTEPAGLTAHVVTPDLDRGQPLTTTTWSLPDRSGSWPRRALERSELRRAVGERLGWFCVATLAALAGADLRRWPPPPGRWPLDIGPLPTSDG